MPSGISFFILFVLPLVGCSLQDAPQNNIRFVGNRRTLQWVKCVCHTAGYVLSQSQGHIYKIAEWHDFIRNSAFCIKIHFQLTSRSSANGES